ncbi:MAG: O-antigen ligase family protein [Candidatus Fimivivens sp.]
MNIENVLLAITLANIFFLSTGLAGIDFGYAAEICAVLLLGVLLFGAKRFFKSLIVFFMRSKSAVLIAMAVYLSVDATNFFIFGDLALAWQKYRVVGVLILLFASLCILRHRPNFIKLILLVVGLSSVVVSIYSLAYYFLPIRLPLFYTARFSMRRDYNMYATQLIVGFIALVFGVIATKNKKAMIALMAALPVIVAVSILSGSRRVLIMLPVVLPVAALSFAAAGIRLFGARQTGAVIGCLAVITGLTIAETVLFRYGLAQINTPGSPTRSVAPSSGVETQLSARYETIRSSSILEKRKIIWGIAIEEISKYSVPSLVFGWGGGKNISLYDEISAPLDAIYPDRQARLGALSAHNMMLADLLDGGVIKLIALLYLIFASGISCIMLALKRPFIGLPLGMILAVCMVNSMVSNRFGLLYDRYFVLFAAMVAIEYQIAKVLTHDQQIGGNSR